MLGQSIEVPTLGGHGKLYLEGATQYRHADAIPAPTLRATRSMRRCRSTAGPLTTTLEIKSNRNFYPVAAAVDLTRAPEFNVVTYSFVPPAETPTILDTEFGYFNACVNGGRLRADVRATDSLLVYGQGIFADTKSEQSGLCDAQGHTVASGVPAATLEDIVWDGLDGVRVELRRRAVARVRVGGRAPGQPGDGEFFYRERHVEYSIVKYLGGPYSIELQGFHRLRREDG